MAQALLDSHCKYTYKYWKYGQFQTWACVPNPKKGRSVKGDKTNLLSSAQLEGLVGAASELVCHIRLSRGGVFLAEGTAGTHVPTKPTAAKGRLSRRCVRAAPELVCHIRLSRGDVFLAEGTARTHVPTKPTTAKGRLSRRCVHAAPESLLYFCCMRMKETVRWFCRLTIFFTG